MTRPGIRTSRSAATSTSTCPTARSLTPLPFPREQENLSFELVNHEAKINKIEQFLEAVALENFLQQYFDT